LEERARKSGKKKRSRSLEPESTKSAEQKNGRTDQRMPQRRFSSMLYASWEARGKEKILILIRHLKQKMTQGGPVQKRKTYTSIRRRKKTGDSKNSTLKRQVKSQMNQLMGGRTQNLYNYPVTEKAAESWERWRPIDEPNTARAFGNQSSHFGQEGEGENEAGES